MRLELLMEIRERGIVRRHEFEIKDGGAIDEKLRGVTYGHKQRLSGRRSCRRPHRDAGRT
jgi:hypothetical protein